MFCVNQDLASLRNILNLLSIYLIHWECTQSDGHCWNLLVEDAKNDVIETRLTVELCDTYYSLKVSLPLMSKDLSRDSSIIVVCFF